MLLLLAESGESGKTMLGIDPIFGLDAEAREGTRAVGPFMALWYLVFIIPFFMWVKDDPAAARPNPTMSKVWGDLKATIRSVSKRKSVYAALVLDWGIAELGPFGVISVIAAAVFTYVGGRFDATIGPKPVIIFCIFMLLIVSSVVVGMSREQVFGVPLAEGSNLPDIIFFTCGTIIGGAGGALYAASRSLMVRHTDPERPTEAFGLFALSGKATAFLAPFLIGVFTAITGNVQLGFLPVIFLFILGLVMLRWVNKDGDRAEWSVTS